MIEPRTTQPFEPKGTALIVDDNERYQGMLARFVQSLGYRCVLAENGVEALEWLETNPAPDVMLCDIVMPRMDGIELLDEMRSRAYKVPVLVITGEADSESVRQCIALGAAGYVTKPFVLEQLRERIAAAIAPA